MDHLPWYAFVVLGGAFVSTASAAQCILRRERMTTAHIVMFGILWATIAYFLDGARP